MVQTPGIGKDLRRAASRLFWKIGAVKVDLAEPFVLASGNRSPVYFNCRLLISDVAFMSLFVSSSRILLAEGGVDPEVFAGGETAGIPFAAHLAAGMGRPMVYVRKKPKGYGTGSQIEGTLRAGSRVLLVEDLITDGGSKLGFVHALREQGAEVEDCLVVCDRQQGGDEALGELGVRLHSLCDRDEIVAAGLESAFLDPASGIELDAYFTDPEAWHRERGYPYDTDK